MQYTLRNIPESLDLALRELARRTGKSLNTVAIEALAAALNLQEQPLKRRDLSDIAGSWIEDPIVEASLADQRAVDPELWP